MFHVLAFRSARSSQRCHTAREKPHVDVRPLKALCEVMLAGRQRVVDSATGYVEPDRDALSTSTVSSGLQPSVANNLRLPPPPPPR
jgi:hypothetical protein